METALMFSDEYLAERKTEASRKLQEFIVLQEELKTIKKDANFYNQQPNSNIFFKVDNKDKVSLQCQDSIAKLKEEMKNLEQMTPKTS
uniref:Uncharacterized protein n=1 Tax=Octopus bimaculoides TaxID=37653 RepID=A0A0L8HPQ0_OCTBM